MRRPAKPDYRDRVRLLIDLLRRLQYEVERTLGENVAVTVINNELRTLISRGVDLLETPQMSEEMACDFAEECLAIYGHCVRLGLGFPKNGSLH